MKNCKHKFEFDGGPCIKCGKTVSDLFLEDKSSTKTIRKISSLTGKIVDLDPDWYGKMMREKEEAEMAARKVEEDRIKKIKCPSCKSTNKNHVVKRNDNGIFGPGYASWVVDEYFVCNKCGTMFKDMEKIKKNLKEGRIR